MASADRRCVHLDDPAHGGVLQPPAVLRARHDGRGGEGLSDRSTPERRWRAIALATVLVTASFWSLFYGLGEAFSTTSASADAGTVTQAGAGIGLALLLVPAVFAVAAFTSGRENAPIMTLAGMGLLTAVGSLLLAVPPPNPLAALVAGYAAGAAVTLSRPAGTTLRHRGAAAVVVAVIAFGGFLVAPAPTAWVAPALPFTAMGLADAYTPRPTMVDDDA